MKEPYQYLLNALKEREIHRLQQCLQHIDQHLLECQKHYEQYHKSRLVLQSINEKLSRLGATPLAFSEEVSGRDLGEIISKRIERFRSQGKL